MSYPYPGLQVSHGTLRNDDLLESFADALESCIKNLPENWQGYPGVPDQERLIAEARDLIGSDHHEDKTVVADELLEYLDSYSPPYCRFGTHEGDGACFGWWPDLEAIEDLPKVSDPSEVEDLGEDCVFVNDHGNVTVYGGDGSILWDCV